MHNSPRRRILLPQRRLLVNNVLLFVTLFLTLTFVRLSYEKISDAHLFSEQDLAGHLRPLQRIQPYRYPVLCQSLFENDPDELVHAASLLKFNKSQVIIPNAYYNISRAECDDYRSQRFNESFHVEDTQTNRRFPLAFTIVMHENVQQLERLLRVIYRPQNFYCIHVDARADEVVFNGVQAIARCFDNVVLASKRERVYYATFSRLQADLNCMQDLLQYPSWKYLFNMANTELPLRSNSELVKIFSIYRGFNDVEGVWARRNMERFQFAYEMVNDTTDTHGMYLRSREVTKKPPPHGIVIVKGSVYGGFSRAFMEFVQTSPIAKDLLEWSRDTYSPDEHYWSTLNFNTHLKAPGGYKAKGDPAPWSTRFVNWGEYQCHGESVRSICVFGVGDLPLLLSRHEMFTNKFLFDVDPIAYQCVEELITNRSKLELPLAHAEIYHKMPFLLPA